jgi:hypothetical protein
MDLDGFATALALGLLAGGAHALTGPDHMAGVAPFAASQGRRAWRVGLAWGLGHASGAAIAAGIAVALRAWIPGLEEHLSAVSERIVGVVLCCVGAIGLRAALRTTTRTHRHDGLEHSHFLLSRVLDAGHASRTGHSAFVIGLLHGSAGLSHLFAVLPALALPGIVEPALYLAGYGGGSLLAITGFAGLLGRLASDASRVRMWLAATSGLSLLVGLAWIVHPFG